MRGFWSTYIDVITSIDGPKRRCFVLADRKGVRSPKLEAAALNLGGSAKMFPRRSRSHAILEL
jgi:hypothetical protein